MVMVMVMVMGWQWDPYRYLWLFARRLVNGAFIMERFGGHMQRST